MRDLFARLKHWLIDIPFWLHETIWYVGTVLVLSIESLAILLFLVKCTTH